MCGIQSRLGRGSAVRAIRPAWSRHKKKSDWQKTADLFHDFQSVPYPRNKKMGNSPENLRKLPEA
jgi:hypothetical protein